MLALLLALAPAIAQDAPVAAPPRYARFLAQTDGLQEPAAAAWHKDGLLVVAESFASRLAFVRPDGAVERRLDLRDEDGGLVWPQGVECLADGSILVSDLRNARVTKLGADGTTMQLGERILIEPMGVAEHAGRVYVADAGHGRVLAFGGDGSYPRTYGSAGRGKGLLVEPVDVAVDAEGRVWVVDPGTPKLVCYGPDGALLVEIEGHGPHEGLFANPSAVEVALGHVWVCDRDNHRVQCFTQEGALVHAHGVHALLPHEGKGRLHYPSGLAVHPDGKLAALVEPAEDRLQFLGASEDEPDPLANIERNTAAHVEGGIAAAEQTLVVLEPSGPDARLYDLRETEPIELTRFLVRGTRPGAASQPLAIALDPAARLVYVADARLSRVSAVLVERDKRAPLRQDPFLPKLARLVDLEAAQTVAGMPAQPRPQALCFADGELWVADRRQRRAWVLDAKLEERRMFDPQGPSWIDPVAIAVAGDRVWVVDRKARAVRQYDRAGKLLRSLDADHAADGPGRLLAPHGLAPLPDGGAWVADEASGRLVRFDAGLRPVGSIGSRGMGRAQFEKPQGLCTGPDGDLWVVERGNHRVQRLGADGTYKHVFGARLWCLPALQPAAEGAR